MDDVRFDALSRRLAERPHSRRAALALLTGALATVLGHALPEPADAARPRRTRSKRRRHVQHAKGPGCLRCHQPKVPLVCRKAGASPTDPFSGDTCSRKIAARKRFPPHGCCSGATCMQFNEQGQWVPYVSGAPGRCACYEGYHDPDGDGSCEPRPPRPCVGLNVACNALDVCCSDPTIRCAIVEPQKGTTRCDTTVQALVAQCCRNAGGACADHCQCCESLRCQNGACVPPPNVCHSVGDSCADGEPCCAGAGSCKGGRCCLDDLVSCPAGCGRDTTCPACCGGYCFGNGQCGPLPTATTPPPGTTTTPLPGGPTTTTTPSAPPCKPQGQICTTDAECCNDVPCLGSQDGGTKRCRYD